MGLKDVVAKRRAEREKPKTLAELRARKEAERAQVPDPRKSGLAALRKSKQDKRSKRQDFSIAGVRFHNARQENGYWLIDVTNGDRTYTLHNRHGAWMHNVDDEGRMKEPVVVARMLGLTTMSQLEMCQHLMQRLEREQRARGIPTKAQLLRQHEEEAKTNRRKKRQKETVAT